MIVYFVPEDPFWAVNWYVNLTGEVDCSCPDWKYRFAYMATQLGYKYGEPQNERNKYHRTNKENYRSIVQTYCRLIK